MPSPTIQFKRGILANLPGLKAGEPGFTTDSYDLYVGIDSTSANNQFVGSGRYWSVNSATKGGGVNLVEGTNNGTDYITLKSPDTLSGITTYTFPASPTNGNFLKTNASGDLSWEEVVTSNITTAEIAAATLVTESEGIGSNDNDTTLPTSAAVKDYVDSNITAQDLDVAGDSGTGAVDLDSQSLTIAGTSNEIETSASNQTVTIGLPAAVTVTTSLTTPTVQAGAVKANDGTSAITIADSTGKVTMAGELQVTGNLIVDGSTTQVNSTITTIEDQLLDLGMADGAVPSSDLNKDVGVLFNYFTDTARKAALFWDDSTSRIVAAAHVTESSGVLTTVTSGALEVASLYVNGCTGSAVEVIGCSSGEVVITNATIDGGSF